MARAGKAARVVGQGNTDRIGLLHPLGARRRRGQRLDARGIRVHVATNSLAATMSRLPLPATRYAARADSSGRDPGGALGTHRSVSKRWQRFKAGF